MRSVRVGPQCGDLPRHRMLERKGYEVLRRERGAARGSARNATGSNRYRMVEKLVSIGDDFNIQNDHGEIVYKVDGKALRIRDTLVFRDAQGNEICKIQSRIARIRDTMEIEDPSGHRMAIVHKKLITPIRDRFVVKIGDGDDIDVTGNILAHEYRIGDVATVSRKWFRIRDSYGVEVHQGMNDALVLAITVVIDQMTSDIR